MGPSTDMDLHLLSPGLAFMTPPQFTQPSGQSMDWMLNLSMAWTNYLAHPSRAADGRLELAIFFWNLT